MEEHVVCRGSSPRGGMHEVQPSWFFFKDILIRNHGVSLTEDLYGRDAIILLVYATILVRSMYLDDVVLFDMCP